MSAPADCRACGACCFSDSPTYVRLLGDDWSLLGPEAERWAWFEGNRAYLRMEAGHCAALAWGHDPGSGEVRFHCSIYDRRPTLCRELGRGSPECEAERERKQTEVLRRVTA
jgi:Fe-S-cluster containining protein